MSGQGAVRLTGGCQCGAVRYALSALPTGTVCHCRMCQKAVGGPFAALAQIEVDQLVWTRGAPALFQSSSIVERGFCAACGTPLTYQAGFDPTKIDITTCSLDDPNAVPLEQVFGIEGRVAWLDALPTAPAIVTEDKFAGLVNLQHPDHDT